MGQVGGYCASCVVNRVGRSPGRGTGAVSPIHHTLLYISPNLPNPSSPVSVGGFREGRGPNIPPRYAARPALFCSGLLGRGNRESPVSRLSLPHKKERPAEVCEALGQT